MSPNDMKKRALKRAAATWANARAAFASYDSDSTNNASCTAMPELAEAIKGSRKTLRS
jgi:hypothetical protein